MPIPSMDVMLVASAATKTELQETWKDKPSKYSNNAKKVEKLLRMQGFCSHERAVFLNLFTALT